MKRITRRSFLAGAAASAMLTGCRPSRTASPTAHGAEPVLAGEVGLVAATFAFHQVQRAGDKATIRFLDIPRILRDELDMRILDLNTMNFPSLEPGLLEKFRANAEKAGVVMTNLKLNQPNVEIASLEPAARRRGLKTYKQAIDAAHLLGMRWVRPLPVKEKPDLDLLVASLRELSDYAAERDIAILIENFGWMQDDPNSVVNLIAAVDRNFRASPDTGNWNSNEIRYAGLTKTFPLAVTCDFKAKSLGPGGEHKAYDLERCFRIGWDAGFHGPWCIEHGNSNREGLFRELAFLRDLLRGWIAVATVSPADDRKIPSFVDASPGLTPPGHQDPRLPGRPGDRDFT